MQNKLYRFPVTIVQTTISHTKKPSLSHICPTLNTCKYASQIDGTCNYYRQATADLTAVVF